MFASSAAVALHSSFTTPRELVFHFMLLCMKSYDIKKKIGFYSLNSFV